MWTTSQCIIDRVSVWTFIRFCGALHVTGAMGIVMIAPNVSAILPDFPIRRHHNGTLVNGIVLETVLFRSAWVLCLCIILTIILCTHRYIRQRFMQLR